MADITVRNQGEMETSGKVNWRGDQVKAPIEQSIYKTSTIQLDELGARKVVGDRVFRYAKAGGAIGAGDLAQLSATQLINVTAGGASPAGGRAFTWYASGAMSKDLYAEGYLISQSGTAANMGHMYRVKSHPAISAATNGVLTLYDELALVSNVTDNWSLMQNMHKGVTEMTAGTAPAVGVAVVAATTNDYLWLETWGPCNVKCSAVAAANIKVVAGDTGEVKVPAATTGVSIGYSMQVLTASQRGMVFLQIAP